MAKLHRISLDGSTFHARSGAILLDAALAAGVDLPHDCRAGRCGSCIVNVEAGITLGGQSLSSGTVHACRARVFSDLALSVEPVPPALRHKGRVAYVRELAHDTVEVAIELASPIEMLSGQYCRFRFRGFPARCFSPTAPMHGPERGHLHLHIKRVRDGLVTSQLGTSIRRGTRVVVDGPFGHAYLRPAGHNRLVLVGTGTGFAPVWGIASAALAENPEREIVLAAGTRRLTSFYMAPALEQAGGYSGVTTIAAIEELSKPYGSIQAGAITSHLPQLCESDIVYGAGAPALVEALALKAAAAGASFYADPFEPSGHTGRRLIDRLRCWWRSRMLENAMAT